MKNFFLKFPPEIQGGLLIILAFVIIGPNDILVPLISKESSLWQFHLCRSIIVICLISLVLLITRRKLIIVNWSAVIIRSFLYTASMLIYFGCLSFLSIAVVGAGMFTSPIFVLLISYFLYNEVIGFRRILAVIIGSIGVWFILDPFNEQFSFLNFLPVFGGAFLAMGNMATWRLCSKENLLTLNLMFFLAIGLCGLLGTLAISAYDIQSFDLSIPSFFTSEWTFGSKLLWTLIFLQSIGSLIGIGLLTKAYQMADTSYLNVFEYSFFIFAGFSGWFILGQTISLYESFGIILIIVAGIIVTIASKRLQFKN